MQNPPLVHTVETSGSTPTEHLYRDTIRKHCRVEWTATEALYRHFDSIEGKTRVESLYECRTRAWFVRNRESGKLRVAANSCRLRWCPLCSRARRNFIRFQVHDWFKEADHPKFLTLTVKHTQTTLSEQITKIYDAFRSLRKSKFFKDHCSGGIWFFQLCWNQKRHEWHPHLHTIVTGKYMDYKKLRELWYFYTHDSQVLDIRIVKDPKKVGDYVARYASRPCELSSLPEKQGLEAIQSLYGRRIAGSWGTGRVISFRPKKTPDSEEWEYMGSWVTVHELSTSDERAKSILLAYQTGKPLGEGFSLYDCEAFIDGSPGMSKTDVLVDYDIQLPLFPP